MKRGGLRWSLPLTAIDGAGPRRWPVFADLWEAEADIGGRGPEPKREPHDAQ